MGVVLLLMSVGLNVVLSQELRASRSASGPSLEAGTLVPDIVGLSRDGAPVRISFDADVPTVLYYFKDDCGWCERNWPNVNALVTQTRGRYRVIGIAASSATSANRREHLALLPVVTGLDAETIAAYRFYGTPQTVVVAPGGRVLKSWTGAYQSRQADVIGEFFGVALPGLLPQVPSR